MRPLRAKLTLFVFELQLRRASATVSVNGADGTSEQQQLAAPASV